MVYIKWTDVNKKQSLRFKKYYQTHKEYEKERKAKWYKDNKDEIQKRQKEYRDNKKDKDKETFKKILLEKIK